MRLGLALPCLITLSVVTGAGCRTTTASGPPPSAAWESPLDAAHAFDAPAQPAEAVALDFGKHRVFGLQGRTNGWLLWLDTRAPKGQVESLLNVGTPQALAVDVRVGDGKPVACAFDPTRPRTALAKSLFDLPSLGVDGAATTLPGVHLRLGETEFGPLTIDFAASPDCVLGADVLDHVVLLVPTRVKNAVWLLVTGE
ncbi:MAG: hypothetical protein U0228_36245 [Myxococcaceae bacterium]